MDNSMIDVIVTNADRPRETRRTIKTLLQANNDIRIILINTYSIHKVYLKDLSLDRIIEVNYYGNLGQAKAVNIGIKLARTKYIMYCHNDLFIHDSGWVRKAINFLEKNKEAGLVGLYGWKKIDGKIYTVSSLKKYTTRPKEKHIVPVKDFEEVSRTDSMTNIFRNRNIKADERFGRTCTGIWIEVLAKGLKLYVMKLKNGDHSEIKSKISDESPDSKLYKKQRRHERSLRRGIRLLKLKEHDLEFAKIFE